MLGRRNLVLLVVAAIVVIVGLVFGVRWIIGRIHRGETQPAATEVAQAQTPVPSPTEWGSELFPTITPTPTTTPNPTSAPVKTGVDAFGLPEGYQPEAVEEEIPDLKKLAPPETPGAPPVSGPKGLDAVEEILKKGKEIVGQVSGPAQTPTPEPTAAPVRRCTFWVFGCKEVTPTPAPTPTPIPGWVEQLFPGLVEEAGKKAGEAWQKITGPMPTPTPQPKGGIAGTGIPWWPVILIVVVVVFILAFRAGFIGIETD